jgi:hypothetical protein
MRMKDNEIASLGKRGRGRGEKGRKRQRDAKTKGDKCNKRNVMNFKVNF